MAVFSPLFFGPFRVITHQKQIDYDIPEEIPLVNHLITLIIKDFPQLKEYFFDKNGNLEANTAIIINGEDIRGGDGLNTKISPKDRITFFKAAGGG
jgi:molybdopterin converting factor small subunit